MTSEISQPAQYIELKPKWQERFAFFDAYGAPSSPHAREAFKTLPKGKQRLINMNYYAFFFGPFYLLTIGLWKKALSLTAIAILTAVAIEVGFLMLTGDDTPKALDRGISIGFAFLFGYCANYAYYLKTVKNVQNWNPFVGLRFK
jgi:hypothetical protein